MYIVFFFKNEGRKREICFAVQKNCHTAVALHILLKWKHFYINVQKKTQAHEGQGHAVFIQLNTKNKTKIQVSSSKLGTTSIIIRTSLVGNQGTGGKSVCLQCGRPGFEPWVGKIPWRRKWQSTPVLLPGKSHGQRSLVGYSLWVAKSRTQLSDFTFSIIIIKVHPLPPVY